jgi:lysophospholipase L1-like esterase
VHCGGVAEATWGLAGSAVNGAAGGRTFIAPEFAIQQDGYVRQIKVYVSAISTPADAWAFRIFRWNAGTSLYDFIAGEDFTPTATGHWTHTLAVPIAVQMGDIPGLYLPAAAPGFYVRDHGRTLTCRYTAGNIIAANAFASTIATDPELDCLSNRPFLAGTGDSIMAGHNGGNGTSAAWYSTEEDPNIAGVLTVPGGTPTSEIPNQIRAKIGDGTVLQYQNFGKGSMTFAWVASNGIVDAVASGARAIVIVCGVNDVTAGTTWEDMEIALNTIKAAVPASTMLLISEILPYTNGSDVQCARLNDRNASMTIWCAANGVRLIKSHDAMGQLRISTGLLDDLKTEYDEDGVHLTTAGVDAMAGIIVDAMRSL